MDEPRHIAFAPIMNAGRADALMFHFHFACEAIFERGWPMPIQRCLPYLRHSRSTSESEASVWRLCAGWIWIGSDEVPGPIEGPRNMFAVWHSLARKIESLLWFIDLCGGGENDAWGTDGNLHNCGVYVISQDGHVHVRRSPYLYSTALESHRHAAWSHSVMENADLMEQTIASLLPKGAHPRIALANDLRHAMCAWDARRQRMRLQLCVTALETLLIAPSERKYLWDDPIKDRLRSICTSKELLTDSFFDQLKQRRHNAVHRGGLSDIGEFPQFVLAELHVEIALREALCWALMNARLIEPYFEKDEWPIDIPSLTW